MSALPSPSKSNRTVPLGGGGGGNAECGVRSAEFVDTRNASAGLIAVIRRSDSVGSFAFSKPSGSLGVENRSTATVMERRCRKEADRLGPSCSVKASGGTEFAGGGVTRGSV